MTRLPAHTQKAIETRLGAPMRYAAGVFHPDRCDGCQVWTLLGLDALMTRLDPTPLTSDLEQAALILGRSTYELHGTPGHFEITARAAPARPIWHNPPPPGPDCVVVPTHVCNVPFLAPPIPITRPKPKPIPENTEIPY